MLLGKCDLCQLLHLQQRSYTTPLVLPCIPLSRLVTFSIVPHACLLSVFADFATSLTATTLDWLG